MSTTQYHIDMLNEMIENKLLYSYCEDLRAAAARLSELERENARMREALFETHLDLVVYTDIDVARKRLVKRRAALTQEP